MQQVKNKKKTFKRTVKISFAGLLLAAFYALYHFNPFYQSGTSFIPQEREPSNTEKKEIKEEYLFQIRNKIVLVNNIEKNLNELHDVFLEIKKKQGLVKLVKNGEEKTGFINEVRELLRKNNVPYSEEWENGKEPE